MPECCQRNRRTLVAGDMDGAYIRIRWCEICGSYRKEDEAYADEDQAGISYGTPKLVKEKQNGVTTIQQR